MEDAKIKNPKSYSDFTIQHLQDLFGIKDQIDDLHLHSKDVAPSNWLLETLAAHWLAYGFRKSKI